VEIVDQLLETAGLVAPGFVSMKLIYQFGAQRQRAQWEWTVWSVLVGLACDVVARWIVSWPLGLTFPQADVTLVIVRFALALAFAFAAIFIWGLLKHDDQAVRSWFKRPDSYRVWLRRLLTDSAWDEVVDDAVLHERWMEVIVAVDTGEAAFRGWLHAGGREDSKAEPWLYLRRVKFRDDNAVWTEFAGTHGMLLHRDQIKRIRVFDTVGRENSPRETDTALADAEGTGEPHS
jgi:hypothetical protein